ncbi:MAG: hypothetical protein HC930_07180, partial [Hydrococcus sp. SU_1_0]|nr:hypothetical protein [Hydrococcus sp. SU_1_0]
LSHNSREGKNLATCLVGAGIVAVILILVCRTAKLEQLTVNFCLIGVYYCPMFSNFSARGIQSSLMHQATKEIDNNRANVHHPNEAKLTAELKGRLIEEF